MSDLRSMKRQLTQHLIDRRDAGFQLEPETPVLLQGFERFTHPAHWKALLVLFLERWTAYLVGKQ